MTVDEIEAAFRRGMCHGAKANECAMCSAKNAAIAAVREMVADVARLREAARQDGRAADEMERRAYDRGYADGFRAGSQS